MISIDLGSNTIRFAKFNSNNKRVAKYEKIVKTADRVDITGYINEDAISRIIDAITIAKSKIDFINEKVIAVATEALRRANNSQYVIDRIFDATNIKFQIISPEDEGRYTLIAVKNIIKYDNFILIDIGGGSTEVIINNYNNVKIASFDMGIVTFSQNYNSNQLDIEIANRIKKIDDFVSGIDVSNYKICSTAGTPTTIAALNMGMNYDNYNSELINGAIITRNNIDKIYALLLKSSPEERINLVGIGREDLIIIGIKIFNAILNYFDKNECIVVDDGLREGVALSNL
jgi:exopolyphosphatase/guanosine-5'-triphosphate,3'-diphosphate pyrophosphatase